MAKKSITTRWIVNNLGVIILALLFIEMIVVYAVHSYFYSSAKQYLVSKLNAVVSVLSIHSQDNSANFSSEIRYTLENFNEKDKIELMAVNSNGRVVLTSSGFSPDGNDAMPDYEDAVVKGEGSWTGKLSSGEKIMAVSMPISSFNSEFSAVRMVTSLTEIDNTIRAYIIAVSVICSAIILIMIITGLYFTRSIVIPIRQMSGIASKYAKGKFDERMPSNRDDEIGDLCIAINHMAEELSVAETMKNEFISSVSHELRTPLTAIKGWAETLMVDGGEDPETMKKGFRVIVKETDRLQLMVKELLDFSRIQCGHFSLQSATMDVLAELDDAILFYQERARLDNIELTADEPEMLPFIYGDHNRIQQVFSNIIDNALKYSSSGDKVHIKAYEEDNNVIITVSDTGCGIKASDLPRVKEKFYKANHTRRGSGIGLALADEIVRLHGGTLDITSPGEGMGTTVTVTFPAESK